MAYLVRMGRRCLVSSHLGSFQVGSSSRWRRRRSLRTRSTPTRASWATAIKYLYTQSHLLSKWTPLGELKGKLLELQPSRQPHWLKVFVVKIRKEHVSAQREDYFNFQDENENFFLSVPCFKTRIRIFQLSLVLRDKNGKFCCFISVFRDDNLFFLFHENVSFIYFRR